MNLEAKVDDNEQSLFSGNCWFLSAAGTIALKPELFAQVVPSDQSFGEGYAGM